MLKFDVNENQNTAKKIEKEIKHRKKLLSKDLKYFKEIPEELLLWEEKEGVELSENGILQYAFERGITIENVPQKLFKNRNLSNKIIYHTIMERGNMVDVIKVLKAKGRGNKEILEMISNASKDLIAQNLRLFDEVLTYLRTGISLQTIIDKIFVNHGLNKIFTKEDIPDKVARLKELYENYPAMLEFVSPQILLPEYKKISVHKLQLIVRVVQMKSALMGLSHYELELYTRMSNSIKENSDGWQEFENNILSNFKADQYKELIDDLMKKSKIDEKMTKEELQKLTDLFSGYSINFFSGNIFNITKREELKHFEEIRDLTCDTILRNPQLDEEEAIKPITKYLKSFIHLSTMDRMKMAILQKQYNLTLKEAEALIRTFGKGIEEIVQKKEK